MSDAVGREPLEKAGEPGRLTPAFRPRQAEKQPPCQVGCPNCGDIRGWIGTIAQRNKTGLSLHEAYEQAWRMITDVNPFPSVLGRVCPHPCESHCNRSALDEPLAINAMERFLGDWAIAANLPLTRLHDKSLSDWIGVTGAGPSGLSFAYQMARRGYRVTVYEQREQAGGMLRFGIPDYRLPPAILDAEIQRILDFGVELHLGTGVGRDITFDELKARHSNLYIGVGAQQGRPLGVPGEAGASVWTGTDYLNRVNCGEAVDLGQRVVVVGGGNTAVDAARAARRTGASVTILYRRSREEMPAIEHEVEEALEEGVEISLLVSPVRLVREANELRALVACRMQLGEPDASGRRRPLVIPDSEFEIPVDSVIAAVSQEPDISGLSGFGHENGWLTTDDSGALGERVWAGGDALELGIAGTAIAHGRIAAEALDAKLRGQPLEHPRVDERPIIGPEGVLLDFHDQQPAARPSRLTPEERLVTPGAEVSAGIGEQQFLDEASRCFSCGSCGGCQQCWMFCSSECFTRLEEVKPGVYFTLSLDQCQECGKCAEICPCGYIEIT